MDLIVKRIIVFWCAALKNFKVVFLENPMLKGNVPWTINILIFSTFVENTNRFTCNLSSERHFKSLQIVE